MKLIQLPDGTWIDPDYVKMIAAADEIGAYSSGGVIPPRIIVQIDDDRRVCEMPSMAEARTERDRLAAIVSGASAESADE